MSAASVRPYESPLRTAQAQGTRERILVALERLLQKGPETDVLIEAIAAEASVERRTIFRHFESRESLFDAFWVWFNSRHALTTAPRSIDDLIAAPRETFAGFDKNEGVIRASLHTPSGRAMRARVTPVRRAAFAAALSSVTHGLPENEAARITALAHLLFSAPAWEVMKDFGGLSGTQAGEAASWALRLLLSTAAQGSDGANIPKESKRKHK